MSRRSNNSGGIRKWLPLKLVAEALCMSQRMLRQMSERGEFPAIIKTGPRTYRVAEDAVAAWQEAQVRKAEEQPERARRKLLAIRRKLSGTGAIPDFVRWTNRDDE